jgi:uncharacterized protein (DUF58 family)
MADANKAPEFLDPQALNALAKIDLIAREIVEGYLTGLHRSPKHGFSVEFAGHREYTPGDDLRYLDWRVLAKSDRYYIKQYEQETNMSVVVLLDTSESMKFGSDQQMTKMRYASFMTAALAYLVQAQGDLIGLSLFSDGISKILPPSSSQTNLKQIFHELEQVQPTEQTNIAKAIHETAERLKRRSLIVVISDFFYNTHDIENALRHFQFNRHEVLCLQVMDKHEVTFPYDAITQFKGLEQYPELIANPRVLRQAYLEEVEAFRQALDRGCQRAHADLVSVTTDMDMGTTLSAYLHSRKARRVM